MRYFIYIEDDLEDDPVIVTEVAADYTIPQYPEYGDGSDYADMFADMIVPGPGKVASEEQLLATEGGTDAISRWRGQDDSAWERLSVIHHRRMTDEELIRLRDEKGDPIAAELLDSDDDYERTKYTATHV